MADITIVDLAKRISHLLTPEERADGWMMGGGGGSSAIGFTVYRRDPQGRKPYFTVLIKDAKAGEDAP